VTKKQVKMDHNAAWHSWFFSFLKTRFTTCYEQRKKTQTICSY